MIWLLRHAEAEDGSPDAERELTEKGKKQARNAGLALKALGVEPEPCFTSPKVRARDTALIVCEPLSVESARAELAGGPFDPEALAAGLERGAARGPRSRLLDGGARRHRCQVRMKKGGLAGIEKGELMVLLRPPELAAIADGG